MEDDYIDFEIEEKSILEDYKIINRQMRRSCLITESDISQIVSTIIKFSLDYVEKYSGIDLTT